MITETLTLTQHHTLQICNPDNNEDGISEMPTVVVKGGAQQSHALQPLFFQN